MPDHYDSAAVRRFLDSIVGKITASFSRDEPINVVGIRTRGETLAQRITQLLADRGFDQIGRGVLDITLYRDDLSEIGPRPLVRPTNLTVDIDNIPLILTDDVIFTGRTVRAALDELSDFGRPSVIRLAVLADRGGRELPIHADYVGVNLGEVSRDLRVKVRLLESDGADEIVIDPRTTK